MKKITYLGIRVVSKIVKKLHISPVELANIICLIPHKKLRITSEDITNARKYLNSIKTDPDNSAICEDRQIKNEYDLQIIIPAYNVEKYIDGCMESAIAAQRGPYKILITCVNDGSTDSTPILLEKYKGLKDLEIIHQSNKGLSGARNRALENIRAKYVTFLDSDDEIGDINALLSEAVKHNADIAEGSFERFNDKFCSIHRERNINSDNRAHGILYGFPWGKIYKSVLFSNLKFPESYWFEDTINALVLFHLAKKVITRDIICYRYRINPQGISRTSIGNTKSLDTHWITERLIKDRKTLGIKNQHTQDCETFAEQIKINYLRICSLQNKELDKAFFSLCYELFMRYFHEDSKSNNPIIIALSNGDFFKFKALSLLTL